MRPWIIQFGPLFVPTEAREDLRTTAHNLTSAQYVDVMWAERVMLKPASKKPRSKAWPASCYSKAQKGYALAYLPPSNVTKMPRRKS